jgi:hypothetical protein
VGSDSGGGGAGNGLGGVGAVSMPHSGELTPAEVGTGRKKKNVGKTGEKTGEGRGAAPCGVVGYPILFSTGCYIYIYIYLYIYLQVSFTLK